MSEPIELFDIDKPGEVGVIMLGKTGICYTNQTGGVACNHPEAEGTLFRLVLPVDLVALHPTHCVADHALLSQLAEAVPGFVPDPPPQEEAWVKGSIGERRCVVTWANCD